MPPAGAPAAWITEEVAPIPKNIYGVTKVAAEDLCQLFHRNSGMPCLVLRTSRFFPEADDSKEMRDAYSDDNSKANEYLHRRVEIEDVVSAHLLAAERAPAIGFRKYIISATTPFLPEDLAELRLDAPRVVRRRVPGYEAEYERRGWKMFPGIGRVYVNDRARQELGWRPHYDFKQIIGRLEAGQDPRSPLALAVGSKGYHAAISRRALSGRLDLPPKPLRSADPADGYRIPQRQRSESDVAIRNSITAASNRSWSPSARHAASAHSPESCPPP
jgi:Nucleoside-diphosphate-sugar epimerases